VRNAGPWPEREFEAAAEVKEGNRPVFELLADNALCRQTKPVAIEGNRAFEGVNTESDDCDLWLHSTQCAPFHASTLSGFTSFRADLTYAAQHARGVPLAAGRQCRRPRGSAMWTYFDGRLWRAGARVQQSAALSARAPIAQGFIRMDRREFSAWAISRLSVIL
jgi:hypothetical protein